MSLLQHPRWFWLIIVCAMVGADQATKAYFSATIRLGDSIQVTSWFSLVHLLNEGAAFSILADADGWQRPLLIAVSLLVVIPVTFVCLTKRAEPMARWLGAVLVAGGTGNLIDRVQTGAVIDFLDFHWRGLHWPAFNMADIFIVGAAILWLLKSVVPAPRSSDGATSGSKP